MNIKYQPNTPSVSSLATQSSAGLMAFFSIADEWALSNSEQQVLLGSPSRSAFYDWKKKHEGHLSHDTLDRLSYFMGIYKALHILFKSETVLEWLKNRNENPIFKGKSPLNHMISGGLVAMADVRRYLDSIRG